MRDRLATIGGVVPPFGWRARLAKTIFRKTLMARRPHEYTRSATVLRHSIIPSSFVIRASSFLRIPSCRVRAKREKYPSPDDRSVALSQRRRCQYVLAPL